MYYGDLFIPLRRMDIPGIDILSSDPLALAAGNGFLVPKLISSVAHLTRRRETMSETSDFMEQMGNRRAGLEQMKATASLQYLLGINTITSYYPDPYGATHPAGSKQRRTDYAHYNAFVGRLSLLLRGAQHECDVAVLYPIAGVQANFYPTALSMYQPPPSRRLNEIDDGFVNLCRRLLQSQIDFDVVDEPALHRAQVGKEGFRIGDEHYRALVVPSTDAIHVDTLNQLARMARQDVRVVFVGKPPQYAASRRERDSDVRQRVEQLLCLPGTHAPSEDAVVHALREASCAVRLEPAVSEVWVARYRREGGLFYFMVNLSMREQRFTLHLPKQYQASEMYLPDTGEVRQARGASVEVSLVPLSSVFVRCSEG